VGASEPSQDNDRFVEQRLVNTSLFSGGLGFPHHDPTRSTPGIWRASVIHLLAIFYFSLATSAWQACFMRPNIAPKLVAMGNPRLQVRASTLACHVTRESFRIYICPDLGRMLPANTTSVVSEYPSRDVLQFSHQRLEKFEHERSVGVKSDYMCKLIPQRSKGVICTNSADTLVLVSGEPKYAVAQK